VRTPARFRVWCSVASSAVCLRPRRFLVAQPAQSRDPDPETAGVWRMSVRLMALAVFAALGTSQAATAACPSGEIEISGKCIPAFPARPTACPPGYLAIAGKCYPAGQYPVAPNAVAPIPWGWRPGPTRYPGPQPSFPNVPGGQILETGYAPLMGIGTEVSGYGLYSYAILVVRSRRSSQFLEEIFKSTFYYKGITISPRQLNILYIPATGDTKSTVYRELANHGNDPHTLGDDFNRRFYDFGAAHTILLHLCTSPADAIKKLCQGDLSIGGPYIFTYATPASKLAIVPPPFLFVDLSDVNERAFSELLSAFRAQVKREDVNDAARINTLHLRLLEIPLKAADLVQPLASGVENVMYLIVHSSIVSEKNESKH
jgi:hypothetical protein